MSVRLPGRSDGSPNLPISSALQTHGDYPIFRRSNSNWSRSQKARIRNLSLVSIRSPFLLESRPNRLPASCGRSLPGGSRKNLTTKHCVHASGGQVQFEMALLLPKPTSSRAGRLVLCAGAGSSETLTERGAAKGTFLIALVNCMIQANGEGKRDVVGISRLGGRRASGTRT